MLVVYCCCCRAPPVAVSSDLLPVEIMSRLEKARKELVARNAAMMLNLLKGAADDLASTVQAEAEQPEQPSGASAYKNRLAAEAQEAGRRRLSSRAASKKTKRKIADTYAGVLLSRCACGQSCADVHHSTVTSGMPLVVRNNNPVTWYMQQSRRNRLQVQIILQTWTMRRMKMILWRMTAKMPRSLITTQIRAL